MIRRCHNATPLEGVESASRLEEIETSQYLEALELRTDKQTRPATMMMFAWFERTTDSANLAPDHVSGAFVA